MSPQERASRENLAKGWLGSGMTQEQYAGEHDLSPHTLRYWLYKKRGTMEKSTGRFIELKDFTAGQEYVIRYGNGVELKIPCNTSLSVIRSLINL